MFITLEGPDGSGKTTQARLLLERLQTQGCQVVLVHEPGGTPLGDAIRKLLLDSSEPIDPWAEAWLFAAARAQLVAQVIRPALERGAVVVADRYADSTLAYQGGGRRLPLARLRALVRQAERAATPDLTLLLDVPVETGLARRLGDGPDAWTRFEREERQFHERVRRMYGRLAHREPDRWVRIDARRPVEVVAGEIWAAVAERLPGQLAERLAGARSRAVRP